MNFQFKLPFEARFGLNLPVRFKFVPILRGTSFGFRFQLALMCVGCWFCHLGGCVASAQVLFSEIMYNPLEDPAFTASGAPVLDLSEDIHEFIELHNAGNTAVSLAGWKLAGGVAYEFPAGTQIEPKGYLVVAKNKALLAELGVYQLREADLLGPYSGQLSNKGETLRLRNAAGETVDSVSYSQGSPWPIGADALGAGRQWTGLDHSLYRYRGRSLERVSFAHPSNDPANWVASPLPGEPSPGRPNSVQRTFPLPIVLRWNVSQASDGAPIVRASQPAKVECLLSSDRSLSEVSLEYFRDDINLTNEVRTTLQMDRESPDELKFSAVIPGFANRSVIRYRFLANRGEGVEVVSPRAGDPYAWHAYFASPVRASTNEIYDLFISSASLNRLRINLSDNPNAGYTPKLTTIPNGRWNLTEPAVFVHNGVVRDVQARYNGSFYRRSPERQSYKVEMPRYHLFNGKSTLLITDKDYLTVVGHKLFREAELPTSLTEWVDLYVNSAAKLLRLQVEEHDQHLLKRYHAEQARLHPERPEEPIGRIFKSSGILDNQGPYGRGDGSKFSTNAGWPPLNRYEWVYSSKNEDWRGYLPFKEMIDKMAEARGTNAATNGPALRAYFQQYYDVDRMLTYMAVRNWMATWDDTVHNFYLWQQANGKFSMLPWDFDADMNWGNNDSSNPTISIFRGEAGNSANTHGVHIIKDSFYKAFRVEYRERMFELNNTLLHPDNIRAMGLDHPSILSFARSRMSNVNKQVNLGVFERPDKPVNLTVHGGESALPPARFRASPYAHAASPTPAHSSTTWRIRALGTTYLEPVFVTNSASNLESLLVPFEKLTFGQDYFWQCIYHDANGRPSVPSDETGFRYGGNLKLQTLLSYGPETQWRYNESGENLGTIWREPDYDDSNWKQGAALFGVGPATLPVPFRTPLRTGIVTHYFRARFTLPGDPKTASLRLKHYFDDGLVLYLNGTEILRTNLPAGGISSGTLANRTVVDAAEGGPFTFSQRTLLPGENVLAAEVHQVISSSSDVVFGLMLEGTFQVLSGEVLLSEVMAYNRGAVINGAGTPDWVELFNPTDDIQSVEGMSLTDNLLVPAKFVFPANTLIAPKSHLVIWCDTATNAPGLHAGFALNRKGQTVALFNPGTNGYVLRDSVSFGLQIPDRTIGRTNGDGGWSLNIPTPGRANVPQPTAPPASVKVNEWMASPESGEDWFELFNSDELPVGLGGLFLTDTLTLPTLTRIPDLSFIAPKGFVVMTADQHPEQGADHVNFKLSSSGEAIGLYAAGGVAINTVIFGPQTTGVSQGRLPDGAARVVFFPKSASPGESNYLPLTNVVISEVLSHGAPPLENAVEIQNLTSNPIALGGWYLSNQKNRLRKFRIPEGAVLAPFGFRVFYEYQFNPDPLLDTSFSFSSANGDEAHLAETDGSGSLTGFRASVQFGPAESGVSFGRYSTSVGPQFVAMRKRTFGVDSPRDVLQFRTGAGQPNSGPRIGPVVINEIMYHPPDVLAGGVLVDNAQDEYIELLNLSDQPVPLFDPARPGNTWRLRGEVDLDVPPGRILPPRGFLLLVNFNPVSNTAQLLKFRNQYGVSAAVPLIGPYQGKLSNSSGNIDLLKPDPPLVAPHPDAGRVPYVVVERVSYSDRSPWPTAADGAGPSLQRLNPWRFGNDPLNWFAIRHTAGRENLADTDGDGMPDAWELANGLDWRDPSDAAQDANGDGITNFQEYANGTDPRASPGLLTIASISAQAVPGTIRLVFKAAARLGYRIECRDSFGAGAWLKLRDVAAETSARFVEIEIANEGGRERYYRIVRVTE